MKNVRVYASFMSTVKCINKGEKTKKIQTKKKQNKKNEKIKLKSTASQKIQDNVIVIWLLTFSFEVTKAIVMTSHLNDCHFRIDIYAWH